MLINILIMLVLALFLIMSFFYNMWQLHKRESQIWERKYKSADLELEKTVKELRETETKYRSVSSSLEREQVRARVNKAADEQINSLTNFNPHPKTAKNVNTLKVEKDVKPSSKPKGLNVSKSTMNALMASSNKEGVCQTS